MRFSILTGILATAAVALTCALATSGENLYFVINGIIQLVIVGSLAIPLVCDRNQLPFWAAYAVTAGFVLLKQGQGTEPFQLFMLSLCYIFLGDVSELSPSESVAGVLGLAFHVWSPVWLGAIVGVCFALVHRLLNPKSED